MTRPKQVSKLLRKTSKMDHKEIELFGYSATIHFSLPKSKWIVGQLTSITNVLSTGDVETIQEYQEFLEVVKITLKSLNKGSF